MDVGLAGGGAAPGSRHAAHAQVTDETRIPFVHPARAMFTDADPRVPYAALGSPGGDLGVRARQRARARVRLPDRGLTPHAAPPYTAPGGGAGRRGDGAQPHAAAR